MYMTGYWSPPDADYNVVYDTARDTAYVQHKPTGKTKSVTLTKIHDQRAVEFVIAKAYLELKSSVTELWVRDVHGRWRRWSSLERYTEQCEI